MNLSDQSREDIQEFAAEFLRLYRDPATPPPARLKIGAALGYLVLERDMIPDEVPNVGYLDDIIIFLTVAMELSGEGFSKLSPLLDASSLSERLDGYARYQQLVPHLTGAEGLVRWRKLGDRGASRPDFLEEVEKKLATI